MSTLAWGNIDQSAKSAKLLYFYENHCYNITTSSSITLNCATPPTQINNLSNVNLRIWMKNSNCPSNIDASIEYTNTIDEISNILQNQILQQNEQFSLKYVECGNKKLETTKNNKNKKNRKMRNIGPPNVHATKNSQRKISQKISKKEEKNKIITNKNFEETILYPLIHNSNNNRYLLASINTTDASSKSGDDDDNNDNDNSKKYVYEICFGLFIAAIILTIYCVCLRFRKMHANFNEITQQNGATNNTNQNNNEKNDNNNNNKDSINSNSNSKSIAQRISHLFSKKGDNNSSSNSKNSKNNKDPSMDYVALKDDGSSKYNKHKKHNKNTNNLSANYKPRNNTNTNNNDSNNNNNKNRSLQNNNSNSSNNNNNMQDDSVSNSIDDDDDDDNNDGLLDLKKADHLNKNEYKFVRKLSKAKYDIKTKLVAHNHSHNTNISTSNIPQYVDIKDNMGVRLSTMTDVHEEASQFTRSSMSDGSRLKSRNSNINSTTMILSEPRDSLVTSKSDNDPSWIKYVGNGQNNGYDRTMN